MSYWNINKFLCLPLITEGSPGRTAYLKSQTSNLRYSISTYLLPTPYALLKWRLLSLRSGGINLLHSLCSHESGRLYRSLLYRRMYSSPKNQFLNLTFLRKEQAKLLHLISNWCTIPDPDTERIDRLRALSRFGGWRFFLFLKLN